MSITAENCFSDDACIQKEALLTGNHSASSSLLQPSTFDSMFNLARRTSAASPVRDRSPNPRAGLHSQSFAGSFADVFRQISPQRDRPNSGSRKMSGKLQDEKMQSSYEDVLRLTSGKEGLGDTLSDAVHESRERTEALDLSPGAQSPGLGRNRSGHIHKTGSPTSLVGAEVCLGFVCF